MHSYNFLQIGDCSIFSSEMDSIPSSITTCTFPENPLISVRTLCFLKHIRGLELL